jgi:hypothetical protein
VPPSSPGSSGPGAPGGETGGSGGGSGGGGEPPSDYETVDLISDNGFERTDRPTGCFAPFSPNDGQVSSNAQSPIAGAYSLAVGVSPYGRIGCVHEYGFEAGPIAKSVHLEGELRIDAPTSGEAPLHVCAIVYLANDPQPIESCRTYSPADQGVLHVSLTRDTEGRRLQRVFFQLQAEGTPVEATLDEAHLYVERLRGSEGGQGGGGGGGGGGGNACQESIEEGKATVPDGPPDPLSPCDPNQPPDPHTAYTPQPLTLPAQRPYISLADYIQAPEGSAIWQKFRTWVDQAVFDHNPGYLYSPTDAAIVYARTGNVAYIDDSIARIDAGVRAAEEAIAAGESPSVASDNYLNVGGEIEELALTYDYGFQRLSQAQRERWKAYGDQVVSNLWSPATASWSDVAAEDPWSAWSINNPGNNYFFSFVEATQMWGLATRDQDWLHFLQAYKFPLVVDYYSKLIGGGSREGTGYGGAQRRLWENTRIWRESTGEDLTAVVTHGRESVEYWVNATVPTLDYFAPIGDLSRVSLPELFDYQENLVREAVMAAPGTEAARHGVWWLTHNSVPDTLTQGFTLRGALLQPPDSEQAPTALTYHAPGVGQFFTRSSWSEDATWLQFTAGPYDESHAHEDQGNFTLYRNTWLTVTSNIWSNSGLQGSGYNNDLATGASNVVRFSRPGEGGKAQTIKQNFSDSTMSYETLPGDVVEVHADLSDAYSNNSAEVHSWTRDLEFHGNTLHVHDSCDVAPDVTATFQLHVPVQPVDHGNGSISAGGLQISTDPSAHIELLEMHALDPDFNSGWRIDISGPDSCEFDVDLTALAS